jgi:predicted nucleic acid-binding protein
VLGVRAVVEGGEIMPKAKAYLETTMFNYYFDTDRDMHLSTVAFFEAIGRSEFEGFTSEYAVNELLNAQEPKKSDMLALMKKYNVSKINGNERIERLADKYIANGIIPENKRIDALHIAAASVNELDYILSLNFKHINKQKTKRLVDLVNLTEGYKGIMICSPMEVIDYEFDE